MALKMMIVVAVVLAGGFRYMQMDDMMSGMVPLLNIGIEPGFKLVDAQDQTDKVFLVTGANAGLGFSTSKLLASRGAKVYMTCRSAKKCAAAEKELRTLVKSGTVVTATLDLGSLKSVRAFAAGFKEPKLDGLIANAGMMPKEFALSSDGLESGFQVNHLGHFLLVKLLEPLLVESRSTVVVLSSAMLFNIKDANEMPLSLSQVNNENNFDSVHSYNVGKLANMLFVTELDRRLHSKGVVVNAVHPGMVITAFFDEIFPEDGSGTLQSALHLPFKLISAAMTTIGWDSDTAALTIVGAAVLPGEHHGAYFVPIGRVVNASPVANDAALAKRLWDFSEELLVLKQ